MEGLARRLLDTIAAGKPVRMRDAVKLASAVLCSPEVELAELVLEGGPHQMGRALELAGLLMRRTSASTGVPTPNERRRLRRT